MARGKVQQEYCPSCEHQHPVSLFREVAGVGKICIFCAEKHEREVEKRQVEKTKHDDRFKLAMAESAALDRIREQREAEDRRKRERRVRKERALKKAQKQEISAEDTSAVAQEELARRELARRHLLPFVERFNDRYEAGWVHKDICARLEKFSLDVAERKSPRLMLCVPPRHGKSEIVSRNFPAWHLGKYPEHEFIACSYASDLALGFSRKVREIVRSTEYQMLFSETELAKDSQRADQWNTTNDGGYAAAGVGGPITGKGAHVLVIDDPVKNREEADSESIRQSIWDWYTSTAYTRLAPGGGVLIIQTRWHDDDLSGRLLMQMAKEEGDDWEVIEYPAIATEDERYRRKGEALHPARYPLDALRRIKRAIGDRDWSALYQQKPVADDGDFFTRDMFPRYRMAEQPAYDDMSYYTAWDLAIGQAEQNDETFGITVGVDRNKRIWVVDVRHGRWDSEGIVNQILDTYAVWRSDITGIERGHIEMAIGPYLEQEIQRKGLKTMFIQPLKPGRRDKQSRARPIQALMKRNEVMFRSGCEATQYLIDQMLRFPSGVHDDGCFVAGTLVETTSGPVAIENIVPGEMVMTPTGPRRVENSGFTGRYRIFELTLADGTTLKGTGNHPVYTLNRGFVRLDELEWYDQVLRSPEPWLQSKLSRLTGSFSGVIRSLSTGTTGSITKLTGRTRPTQSIFTGTSGRNTTGPSQQGGKSTTKITTHSTTISTIWSALTRLLTRKSTSKRAVNEVDRLSMSTTSNESGNSPASGTGQRKGGSGIGGTACGLGRVSLTSTGNYSAKSVASLFRQTLSTTTRGSAVPGAAIEPGQEPTQGPRVTKRLPNLSLVTVSNAAENISLSATLADPSALLNAGWQTTGVKAVVDTGELESVYNLTVDGEHVYFANGILVHNCDAMAWIGQMIGEMTSVSMPKPKKRNGWRQRLMQSALGRRGSSSHMGA